MAIVNATDSTFSQEISAGLVLVDFWATWCGPCRMIAPVLEEMSAEMGDQIKIVKVDVDENAQTAANYGIMSIPTLILFKDGEKVEQIVGFKPKEELKSIIARHA